MTLKQQVINTSKSTHMNIRKIRSIRPYLTDYAVRTLVQTTFTVRLDHCNIILIYILYIYMCRHERAYLLGNISDIT